MTKTEAAGWQTVLVDSTLRVSSCISGGVGVRGERRHERMEDITLEGDQRRPLRVVAGEVDLKSQNGVGIRPCARGHDEQSGEAGMSDQACVPTFANEQHARPEQWLFGNWSHVDALGAGVSEAGAIPSSAGGLLRRALADET